MVFPPDLRAKNGGVLSIRMQVILDSRFARPGSDPNAWGGKKLNGGVLSVRMQVIMDSRFTRPGSHPNAWGGKKGEFRDWTSLTVEIKLPFPKKL